MGIGAWIWDRCGFDQAAGLRAFWAAGCCGLALAAGIAWNHYTDVLKAANPLSAVLMSSQPAQQKHNLGTLEQRLSWEVWETTWHSIEDAL